MPPGCRAAQIDPPGPAELRLDAGPAGTPHILEIPGGRTRPSLWTMRGGYMDAARPIQGPEFATSRILLMRCEHWYTCLSVRVFQRSTGSRWRSRPGCHGSCGGEASAREFVKKSGVSSSSRPPSSGRRHQPPRHSCSGSTTPRARRRRDAPISSATPSSRIAKWRMLDL